MELEHLWILVSTVGPGTNPMWTPRDNCISFSFLPLFLPSLSPSLALLLLFISLDIY